MGGMKIENMWQWYKRKLKMSVEWKLKTCDNDIIEDVGGNENWKHATMILTKGKDVSGMKIENLCQWYKRKLKMWAEWKLKICDNDISES